MKALLLSLAFFCYGGLCAQKDTFVLVKAGKSIVDVLPPKEIFHYPQFTRGTVFFKGGITAAAKMNYNQVLDEMHFLDPKGDTLAVTNEKTITYIVIDKDSFYYDQGYFRLIAGNLTGKLAIKRVWKFTDRKRAGAYNTTSSVSAISSRNSYFDGRRFHQITVNEDVLLSKEEQYFFGDKNNNFLLATKKGLLKLFPKEHSSIERYLKENQIDFNNRSDLEKVVRFLGGL